MARLRLVTEEPRPGTPTAPKVSLRLLMAASGRCACDSCLLAYRAGHRNAGLVNPIPRRRLRAVAD